MRIALVLTALLLPVARVDGAPRAADPGRGDPPGAIVATFDARSYAPGDSARLRVWSRVSPTAAQVFRAGAEKVRARRDDLMTGGRVGKECAVSGRMLSLRVGDWPSGLYFVRLAAPDRVGFAPFVVRPRRLGASRVAVVVPTNTWQAYNFRDVDGDGVGDTWYADSAVPSVDLARPYLNRGVPPHFRAYDAGFLRWLVRHRHRPDVLSDDDLERLATGDTLARLYDLIVFPGHEEYVSRRTYDGIRRFRDRGGNLAFLSANNFFYRVERRGNRLYRLGRWRDQGRPEAPLVGARYVGWFENRFANAPYVVVGARRVPWLFRGTGLANGELFGSYGIEVDARAPDSPRGTLVVARIPNVFGRGRSAEMTYYTTSAGAKVFAAGALNFGGSAQWPQAGRLVENLWRELSRP